MDSEHDKSPKDKSRKQKRKPDHHSGSYGRDKRQKKKRDCPCGRGCTSSWSRCYYLTPSAAPPSFEPDPEVVNRIKDLREAQPGLDIALKSHEERCKKKPEISVGFSRSTFAATNYANHPLASSYIADTGADSHIVNSSYRYVASRNALSSETVASGKDQYPIESIGTATITAHGPNGPVELTLYDVAFVPGYFTNIVSISKLSSQNIHMDSGDSILYIKEKNKRRNFAYCPRRDGHWIISTKPLLKASIFSHTASRNEITKSSRRMHEAMGHPGQNSLSVLQKATTGSSFRGRGPSTVECDACALAKASQIINRDPGKTYPIQAPFEQVNIDLFSFIKDQSNYKYILIVVDSWTGFTLAYSLKQKDDSRNAIFEAIAFVSTQFNRKIKTIKLDNETSLKTEQFLSKINRLGIVLSTSAPYTPQQNGRSERVGGEVIRRARAICIQSKFPTLLWCELVKTACYLLNRTPRYRLGNKTPFEIVFKKQPDV
ncbi:hypothetical protein K3495_g15435, partial [Podosphaera aphanis]